MKSTSSSPALTDDVVGGVAIPPLFLAEAAVVASAMVGDLYGRRSSDKEG